MIETIRDLPRDVLGFRARGTVTSRDYETLVVPAVEAALASGGKARMLYHLGEEFSNFEAGAMWQDAKIGLRHLDAWERIAVVTDVAWVRAAMQAFAFLMSGQVRVFRNDEFENARKWVAE